MVLPARVSAYILRSECCTGWKHRATTIQFLHMKNILILIITCFYTSTIFGQITDPVATEVWEPVPRVVS